MLQSLHKITEELSIDYKKKMKRINYLTPTSYLELLNIYKVTATEKSE